MHKESGCDFARRSLLGLLRLPQTSKSLICGPKRSTRPIQRLAKWASLSEPFGIHQLSVNVIRPLCRGTSASISVHATRFHVGLFPGQLDSFHRYVKSRRSWIWVAWVWPNCSGFGTLCGFVMHVVRDVQKRWFLTPGQAVWLRGLTPGLIAQVWL